ncbi:hypothetical protein SCP_0604460 [Sparassis crispa]|uniref:Uncharacterized protein n=1 Tax=Sparassis crispa TaxID=139825 RepID=A0A401GQG8_9APHY|nr:hypothetical protein SCP_0604460 [Sparassis crispa]GBE84467.1 hypothetical protein SCP_0604460 [Sparassis crispa]
MDVLRNHKTDLRLRLVTEKWANVLTEFAGKSWPYLNKVTEYCMEIFEDVMYVFGGTDRFAELGNNVLMALNLRTLIWTHLGGTTNTKATNTMPMLRRFASSRVIPAQKRLYILYGNIGRQSAYIAHRPYGNLEDYNYEDMWSYDIPGKSWRRGRIRGNFPAPPL